MADVATKKFDHAPLLAPGRHYMDTHEIRSRFVDQFDGAAFRRRSRLFSGLLSAVERIKSARLPCEVCIDGSFLTQKPEPDDIDIVVLVNDDVASSLSTDQHEIISLLNADHPFAGLDSCVFFTYPREHKLFGSALDHREAIEGYGLEHSGRHLKGFVILKVLETDVGLRICR